MLCIQLHNRAHHLICGIGQSLPLLGSVANERVQHSPLQHVQMIPYMTAEKKHVELWGKANLVTFAVLLPDKRPLDSLFLVFEFRTRMLLRNNGVTEGNVLITGYIRGAHT